MSARKRAGLQPSLQDGEDGRWHEVWRLVLSAEQEPAAERREFLLSAHSDPFVIREAIAILEASVTYASIEQSFPSLSEERFAPQSGMKIGRYRVGTLLGAGGAGSVYAAFDEELKRAVAIKFFVPRRATSVMDRPLREARAASALNHPNIIVVHEVIETGGAAAIVMELVQGVTLRALTERNAKLEDVLDWSSQLANALGVAHSHGLIHGDIKPENVMVREDGYVKLLDFGLALGGQEEGRIGGGLAGTLRYLSPEQCGGEAPTPASDIFSFGVMLYELTTGKYPFPTENSLGVLHAIAAADPPRPALMNAKLPRAMDDLIVSMMAKEPGARPTAQQAAARLADAAGLATDERRRSARLRWWVLPASLAAMLGGVAILPSLKRTTKIDLARMTLRPMASQSGSETNPTISPDGLWISCLYNAQAGDAAQLQIHSTQGGSPVVIDTTGLAVEGRAGWSPDSSDIVFAGSYGPGKHLIYRAARKGGKAVPLLACNCPEPGCCGVDWSPDGRSLALTDSNPGDSINGLFLVDLSRHERRLLMPPQELGVAEPRFSPDGKWIAVDRPVTYTADDLFIIPAAGGASRRVTQDSAWIGSYDWTSDNRSLIAISARKSGKRELWQFWMDGKREPERLASSEFGLIRTPTVARRKGSLAWVLQVSNTSLWRMRANGRGRPAEVLLSAMGTQQEGQWSNDGRMAFSSDRSGSTEIYIARADGSEQTQVTRFNSVLVAEPRWSPDGRWLAFVGHPDGNADLFIVPCEPGGLRCGTPRRLTRSPATEMNPSWSADGKWLYFASRLRSQFDLWRMPGAGGKAERVTWKGGFSARESADGRWLYYSKVDAGLGFWRMRLAPGSSEHREELLVSGIPFPAAETWALGIRELFYYPATEGVAVRFPAVRAVSLDDPRRVRDLPVDRVLGRGLSLSPDGSWLLRTQTDRSLSLVIIAE
jgi:serine/threonine protein kinase/Tol biopolymer transport system component